MRWLLRVVSELSIIGLTALLAAYLGWWAIWPAAIVIGIRLHALGVLGHLGAHRLTEFPPALNDFITKYFVFGPLGIDLMKYRRFHGAHHNHVGVNGKDPEVIVVRHFKERWGNGYRWKDSLKDLCGMHFDEVVYVMSFMVTNRSMILTLLFFGLFCWFQPVAAVTLALAPITGFVFAHRLRAWTEHDHANFPGQTFQQHCPAWWRRAIYLPHKTWLHYEHHLNPGTIPCELPRDEQLVNLVRP